MDYQSYDDYMRSMLGYPDMNFPNSRMMNMNMNTQVPFQNVFQASDDLERMYPDTYRIVFPMVVSECNMVTMPVTEEMLNRMTDSIYDRAATDTRISVDLNVQVESREDSVSEENSDSRQFSDDFMRRRPRRRNRFFRDFIRVLLLRELLRRRRRFPMRPF